MTSASKQLGGTVRLLRQAGGLSQEELAHRAGLSVTAVSAIERGERFPRAATVEALATALQTDVAILIGDVLTTSDGPKVDYATSPRWAALRELVELLHEQPEPVLRLVLDLTRLILPALPPKNPNAK